MRLTVTTSAVAEVLFRIAIGTTVLGGIIAALGFAFGLISLGVRPLIVCVLALVAAYAVGAVFDD